MKLSEIKNGQLNGKAVFGTQDIDTRLAAVKKYRADEDVDAVDSQYYIWVPFEESIYDVVLAHEGMTREYYYAQMNRRGGIRIGGFFCVVDELEYLEADPNPYAEDPNREVRRAIASRRNIAA